MKQTKTMMKLLMIIIAVALVGCNRMRVKHDHATQVPHVRVAVDSAQIMANEPVEAEEEELDMDTETGIYIPEPTKPGNPPANTDAVIERMMKGEDVDFGE